MRFDQHEKNITCAALVAFKKTQHFFPFFQDLTSIFHSFSRSGKFLGKFQDFFKNSRLCTNTEILSLVNTLMLNTLTLNKVLFLL